MRSEYYNFANRNRDQLNLTTIEDKMCIILPGVCVYPVISLLTVYKSVFIFPIDFSSDV